ncbi:MAG: sugar transferase [Cyanobacteria bacterium P01_F01_bin.153]
MATYSSPIDFPVTFADEGAILLIPERLCVTEAVVFKDICAQLCQRSPRPRSIILDLRRTVFIDSSGIGAIVTSYKGADTVQIPLQLREAGPQVMAVLALTGLDAVLDVQPAPRVGPQIEGRRREEALPNTHPSVRSLVKRIMDIVGSLIGLVVTGILAIPIAIAIRIDSPGPIFFSQERCGWLGKRFRLWKFRSMVPDAEARRHEVENQAEGAFFKNDCDPRITSVGRFLRRTSLDELPQFWNVLKGEMSLVGTRPPTPDEVAHYEVPQWQRLDVRPGMTGEWQVNGRSQVKNFEDVIRLDLAYQENWSLGHDLKLIFKTVWILFQKNSGAM